MYEKENPLLLILNTPDAEGKFLLADSKSAMAVRESDAHVCTRTQRGHNRRSAIQTYVIMEITVIGKLFISLLTAGAVGWIAAHFYKKGKDAKVGLGCVLMFPTAIIAYIIINAILPKVVVITEKNGIFSHETTTYFSSIKTSDGKWISLSFNHRYLANFTDEKLVLLPEYFHTSERRVGGKNRETGIVIASDTIVEIKAIPNYYFTSAPSHIFVDSDDDVEVRWSLLTLDKYM